MPHNYHTIFVASTWYHYDTPSTSLLLTYILHIASLTICAASVIPEAAHLGLLQSSIVRLSAPNNLLKYYIPVVHVQIYIDVDFCVLFLVTFRHGYTDTYFWVHIIYLENL